MLILLCCVYTLSPGDTAYVLASTRQLPVYSVDRSDHVISISFDASWGGDKTLKILDILDRYQIKTTFFLVDIWTQKYPELVKEILARGHEIGNHSKTHAHMSKLDAQGIIRELDGMADGLEKVAGVRPTLFRPPYGEYNDLVVTTARAHGYEAVQWSVDSQDWKNRGAQDIITRATKVKSGDIVLFHNDSQYIVEALPEVLSFYQKNGYSVVPVSEILLTGDTQIDVQGRMKPLSTKIPEV
ncbi:MAG: polysaccharide deacetylase family protein [Clostridia bacterium]|nr:polysaccharide deacetylase family protein [Clostridia bacterium]